ncbi:MAG: 23S rRNA (uracil(1939)-C(5))-methyltransferase RlmD [Clostridia bacterium]|nr:23S rRNA (uracil(1939)-C(5))-methyltransferase RlmD [Clostridia bacterium]
MSKQTSREKPGVPSGSFVLTVTDLNNLGCGVARLPDENGEENGLVVFIRGAVTGDVVETELIKVTPSYAVGRLVRVVTPSPTRAAEDFCTAPEACGGCVYRHLTYEAELESKHRRVMQAFRQAGLADVTVLPPLSTGVTRGYRNKGMYPVRNGKTGIETGFFAQKSHNLIKCAACSLQPPVFAEIVEAVCRFFRDKHIRAYDETTGEGILRHIYLRTTADGEVLVCLVINSKGLPGGRRTQDDLVSVLLGRFPNIIGVSLNVNQKNTNVVLGDSFIRLYGQPYMEDRLCGLRFRISAESFYQVNHDAAELLYRTAAARAGLTGRENLWDLYCGAGTIGLSMAGPDLPPDRRAATVTGVEIVPQAVECAKKNAQINADLGLLPPGIARFFCADAGDPSSLFKPADDGVVPAPDVVVIDPPRKGTTPELIRELSRRGYGKVVYVSCDPETLARDCAVFRAEGYTVGDAQPVDLFPRTGHVEMVVLMSRDKE